jgi:hypothetical protein
LEGVLTALRVVDPFPDGEREAGMMWRYPGGDADGRECWWIVLPMTHPDLGTPGHPSVLVFLTTERASDPPHEMWDVSGTPPLITVTPSIDVMRFIRQTNPETGVVESVREGSYWHGWIKDGELTT